MARFMFLFAWLRGPRVFSRFALFYVLGMLLLFYALIGGWPHVPASPAHAVKSAYAPMPKPNPIPANTAQVLRDRMNNGPRIKN